MARHLTLVALAALTAGCGKEAAHNGKPVTAWRQDLRSPDANARREAAAALGTIGTGAKSAVPDLAALLAASTPHK